MSLLVGVALTNALLALLGAGLLATKTIALFKFIYPYYSIAL